MIEIIVFILILAADLATKAICASWLPTLPKSTYTLIEGVFSLKYVKNRGAAFGLMEGKQGFFSVATVLMCALLAFFIIKERKQMPKLMKMSLVLILSGAIGNFVDRIAFGFVRDMFYFELIDFAVFNVADAAITIGAIILALDILFFKGGKYLSDKEKNKPEEKECKDE